MHNTRITYTTILIVVLLFTNSNIDADTYLNNDLTSGLPIATTTPKSIPFITDLNQNKKSSQIQNIIFPEVKKTQSYINKNNDSLSEYVINIFCSELTSRYIKVASGSGVFLSDPDETKAVILTNAHVARHLLDSNKKCVGRTGSPTKTTHTLTLRYIPHHWLNQHNQYVIGDPDQSSTGEYDFAIIESTKIKTKTISKSNIYSELKMIPKLKISNYSDDSFLNNTYIYSYPAQASLTKNVQTPLYLKKDLVTVSNVYASPNEKIQDSLLDVSGSKYIDHGSSGGMVVSQGLSNSIIGLSSVLIKKTEPQTVRVVTIKHVLSTIEADLGKINNAQTDSFLYIIKDILTKKEVDIGVVQIFKNIKLTSVLEQHTRNTLRSLNIIK